MERNELEEQNREQLQTLKLNYELEEASVTQYTFFRAVKYQSTIGQEIFSTVSWLRI
jgi:hypothetical protein